MRFKCILPFFIALVACFFEAKSQLLEDDLKLMLTWFTGEFDNFQQVWMEKERKYEFPHEHIHSIFAPIKFPGLGENVFYVKQFMDGDPKKMYRQRIYSFSLNKSEKAIQLDIYAFPVDSLFIDLHLYPEKLKGLTAEKLTSYKGCEVYWKKINNEFIGYMKDRTCNFVSKRSGKRIYATDSLKLTQNEIWIRDEATDEEGKYVYGHKAKIHHKLKKCRFYKGWAAIQKEGKENEYFSMRDIVLHDQGQKVQIVDKEGTKTPFWVELSQVVYQSGLPVLKLAIYQEGKEKSIAYTWANPEAKLLGINIRSHQAGFTLIEK